MIEKPMIKVAPSLMCADLGRLIDVVRRLEEGGADLLHIDVMDGHFVSNFCFGPQILRSLKRKTKLHFDVHLMIENPERYVELFAKEGADIISFHIETSTNPFCVIREIKEAKSKASIAINPETPVEKITPFLKELSMILIMAVNPGFSMQLFIPNVLPKIKYLRDIIQKRKLDIDIAVDGGVDKSTIPSLVKAGANVFVGGYRGIFKEKDLAKGVKDFRRVIHESSCS